MQRYALPSIDGPDGHKGGGELTVVGAVRAWWRRVKAEFERQGEERSDNEILLTYEHYRELHGPDDGTVQALGPEVARIRQKRAREREKHRS